MQFDFQMEGPFEALRKMMEKEVEVMVISTVQQVIGPIVESIIRKVVKEEIQSAQEIFLTGENRSYEDEIIMLTERSLELKFLDEVSVNVLTGKAIQGKGGVPLRVALVDKTTGRIVENGPEASAKVEILVLEASPNDNEKNMKLEDFNSRIIMDSDKKRPHFAKSKHVYLNKGSGVLCNLKLGHDSGWMKSCKCKLGARIVGNLSGIVVKEAWTESFIVSDRRSKLYEKHYPPFLSDELWRLENIGKDGPPCKRLNDQGILTVQDFLFLHSIDPQRLQKVVGGRAKTWKATVEHARTCIIDDEKIYLYHPYSFGFKVGVIFDVVGRLKGVIRDFHYVPINNLSEVEKACTRELLLSAFENRKDLTSFDDETSLLDQFPYESYGINDATSIDGFDQTEPDTSYQSNISPSGNISHNFGHFGSIKLSEAYIEDPNESLNCMYSEFDSLSEHDIDSLMSFLYTESNSVSEAESHS